MGYFNFINKLKAGEVLAEILNPFVAINSMCIEDPHFVANNEQCRYVYKCFLLGAIKFLCDFKFNYNQAILFHTFSVPEAGAFCCGLKSIYAVLWRSYFIQCELAILR